MNDTAQIIIAVSTLITAMAAAIISLKNAFSIHTIQKQTDGLMQKLEEAAEAKGNLQGRKDEGEKHMLEKEEPVKVEIVKIPPLT